MTRTRLPAPPEPVPVVLCRCCQQPTRVHYQPGFLDRPGHFAATCDTRGCGLQNYTLSVDGYETMDLTAYLDTGRKKREATP